MSYSEFMHWYTTLVKIPNGVENNDEIVYSSEATEKCAGHCTFYYPTYTDKLHPTPCDNAPKGDVSLSQFDGINGKIEIDDDVEMILVVEHNAYMKKLHKYMEKNAIKNVVIISSRSTVKSNLFNILGFIKKNYLRIEFYCTSDMDMSGSEIYESLCGAKLNFIDLTELSDHVNNKKVPMGNL